MDLLINTVNAKLDASEKEVLKLRAELLDAQATARELAEEYRRAADWQNVKEQIDKALSYPKRGVLQGHGDRRNDG